MNSLELWQVKAKVPLEVILAQRPLYVQEQASRAYQALDLSLNDGIHQDHQRQRPTSDGSGFGAVHFGGVH